MTLTIYKRELDAFNHKELTAFEDSGLVTFDIMNGGQAALIFQLRSGIKIWKAVLPLLLKTEA